MGGEAMPLSLAALNMTLNETLQLLKDLQLPPLEMVESEAVQAALVALYSVTGAAALLLNALQIYILCTGRRFVSSTTYLYSSIR
jgi:spore maturation protein SpmB